MLCQALTPAAAGWNPDKKKPTSAEEVQATIESFLEQDPGLQKFFDSAHGYAVFPKIYRARSAWVVLMALARFMRKESTSAMRRLRK